MFESVCVYDSLLSGVLSTLHLLDGNLRLFNAVSGAHLLHGGDVLDAEVDNAFGEALNLRLDHESGEGVLVVCCGSIRESLTAGVHVCILTLFIKLLMQASTF